MSRIKWERAKALIQRSNSQLAECPTSWPERFAPVQLAHLQAPPIDKEYSHTRQWQAAIESAAGAGELPSVLQYFKFAPAIFGCNLEDSPAQTSEKWQAQCITKKMPAIAAADFVNWLQAQKETRSEHIQAWFDATAPAQTAAPVATTGRRWTTEKLAELKAYRAAHTMEQTAAKFGITEQRIRKLLPTQRPPATPFSGPGGRTTK